MKTAFYTFFGVLAAGIVLFALYIGWQRLDRWEQGKNYWIAQLSQAQINTSPVIPGLSSEDYQRQIGELDGQLRVHQRPPSSFACTSTTSHSVCRSPQPSEKFVPA